MNDYRTILDRITSDRRYLSNLDWGKARPGHPEGTVRAHIEEIERNLEALRSRLTEEEYWKLKTLIHTHDSFKAEARAGVSILDPNSHASLAKAFLCEFCEDEDMLAMVQFHDEPYALFRQFESKGSFNSTRFEAMLKAIRDWNLFLAFNIIDDCTAGKSRDPLKWLFRETDGRVQSEVYGRRHYPKSDAESRWFRMVRGRLFGCLVASKRRGHCAKPSCPPYKN